MIERVDVVKCDRPELLRRDIGGYVQPIALRAIEGVPLLVAEAPEVRLADAGCLAAHALGHEEGCVEIGAAAHRVRCSSAGPAWGRG
jgi:hypothetical protein